MTVSIISSGAGSVAVSARPAFANTCGHTGFTDGERNASEILKRLQVARCPDHVLRLAQLDNGAARLLVRALHRIDHLAVWNVVGTQSIWIENDLVLPNHAADARHFGDIRHRFRYSSTRERAQQRSVPSSKRTYTNESPNI